MNTQPNPPACSACGKPLTDKLFARVKHGDQWVLFCSPECLLSQSARDRKIQWDDASYVATAQMFSQM